MAITALFKYKKVRHAYEYITDEISTFAFIMLYLQW